MPKRTDAMQENRTKTLSEHREHFAKFVSLLTGELGVEAVFGDEPGSTGQKRIVLPKIEDLDGKRLDFLYALCLREAGLLSMSKRSVASIASHKTQGELATSFAIESGRVERALMRKFAGAQEILDQHWKTEAADAELGPMAFGLNPAKAKIDQVFPFVAKWALVGKPAYGWDKIFPQKEWMACVEAVEAEPMKSLIATSRLRKWEDASALAGQLWGQWVALRGEDKTAKLTPSPKAKALAEVERALSQGIPEAISELVKKCEELEAKAKAAREKSRSILGDNQAKLDGLNKAITALGKQKAPFQEVAHLLDDARDASAQADSLRSSAAAAKEGLDSCAAEANGRKTQAEQAAQERAQKDGEKGADIQKRIDELEAELSKAGQSNELPDDVAQRIADLEKRVEQARHDMASKQSQAEEQIKQEQSKADAAEGARKEKLEKRVAELSEKLSAAQAKSAQQQEKLQERSEQMREVAEQRAKSAQEKMKEQIEELEDRLRKAQANAQDRQEKAMQKATPTASLQKRAQKLSEQMASGSAAAEQADKESMKAREDAYKAASKNKSTSGLSEEELVKKIEELEKALGDSQSQKEDIVAPARESNEAARQARAEMKAVNKQASAQAYQEMQKLQEQLDAQGIECDLVERMEEIDGWEQANEVQRKFDKEASEAMGEPVINGSGGGAGNRNVMEEISLRAQGIHEINPNEIFSGVEKLSPLSGFSQTGVDGDGGHPEQSESSGMGFISSKPHLVWRKDRDKVLAAPSKDVAVSRELQAKYAKEIGQVKKVFQAKMKPSFKTKFRGGREEGQLDGRAIWKLAARQGDDFYEIDCKKPDNKASATILVDMSGSLASLGEKAQELVRACVLMLSEGLAACEIEHEILGHSAPYEPEFAEQKIPDTFNRKGCRLETVVAKSFTDKSLAGLSSIELKQADNSDGEALRIALGRLKKRPTKKKILFMISDGKPFMQDSDIKILDEDLRRALLEAAAQKVSVVSIGFGANGHPVLGSEHIGISTVDELAKALESRL
jgi:uncharacterized coiled-coil DUF342 family protein